MKALITGPAKAALKAIFEYYRSEEFELVQHPRYKQGCVKS